MIASTTGRMAAVLAAASALTAFAGAAQAETPGPTGMSPADDRSLILRSEALNQEHGLGRHGAVPPGMTAAEYRALMLRSAALNRMYGLGGRNPAAVASQPTSTTPGVAWGPSGSAPR